MSRAGLFRLRPADAISAYYLDDHSADTNQRIIATEPDGLGYVQGWSARRRDLRITHEERERFAREYGIGEVEVDADADRSVDEYAFRKKDGSWELIYEGKQRSSSDDLKGFYLIAHLLRSPGINVYAGDLLSAAGVEQSELTPAQRAHVAELAAEHAAADRKPLGINVDDVHDLKTRTSLKERRDELLAELAEAKRDNDIGREQQVQQKIEEFHKHVKSAYGRSGSFPKERSRFRRNVSKVIDTARKRIQQDHPSLGSHLADTIKTGTFCSYRPGTHLNWKF